MAYNYNDYENKLDLSFDSPDPEERKRKLASIVSMISGQQTPMEAGYNLVSPSIENAQNKINQFGQMVQGPAQPEVVQPTQVQGPAIPQANVPNPQQTIPNANVPAPNIGQLPQAGPGIQVASNQQGAPAALSKEAAVQVAQTNPQITAGAIPGKNTDLNDVYHESVIAARNEQDPQKRRQAYAALLSNESVPEGYKAMANRFIAEDYLKQRQQSKAEEKIAQATPNDLARYMQSKTEEGSYLKAILFARLGLTELAKEEQQKLGAGTKTSSAVDATTGQRYTVERNANGEITRAFDVNGKKAGQEEIARLSAATLPTQAHQLPSVHGTPVQRQNAMGQVETGLMMYDPQSQSSYVQVGNQRLPTTGWTTMAQNVQAVYGAAGAQQQGKQAAQTGVQQPMMPPLAGQVPVQQAPVAQPQVQTQPGVAPQAGGQARPQAQPQVQAQPIAQPQVQAQPIVGGAGTVVQRPGESYTSFQQRQKIAEEQAAANIQANKEVNVAERKPGAEARGKIEAKDINNQRYANETYGLIRPISDAIKQSTGSGLGTQVDKLAGVFGVGTQGAAAKAQLDVLGYNLVSNVPRFEGAQSDRDVALYERAAGDIANSEKPINVRLAALNTIVQMLKKYDKKGENDWTFSGEQSQQGQIKIIKREKVQ